MGAAEIQEIMQRGGTTTLLIILLVTGLALLWRYHLSCVKSWTESQLVDTRAMIAASERSTSAILNLTELLKANAASANAYQVEMRSRVYGELNELQKFRGEMEAHWQAIEAHFNRRRD
jgi:hypothetical protein